MIKYDENGREIINDTSNDKIENSVEVVGYFETEESDVKDNISTNESVIFFAELESTSNGNLNIKTTWEMTDFNNGAFFIYSNDDSIKDKWVILSNINDDEVIWESPIVCIPDDSINVEFNGLKAKYMTKKAISSSRIPKGNNTYIAKVENQDDCLCTLKVVDLIDYEEDIISDTFTQEDDKLNEPKFTWGEPIEPVETNEIEEDLENAKECISREFIINEYVEAEEFSMEEDEKLTSVEDGVSIESLQSEEIKVCEQVQEPELAFDPLMYLVNVFATKKGVKLEITDSIENENKNSFDLIIEKLGNEYRAVFKGITNKNITLVNDEKPYFEFNYGIELFVKKVETMLMNMFGFSEEEVISFNKAIIIDEDSNLELKNSRFYSRKECIKIIAEKASEICYIGEDNFYLKLSILENRQVTVESLDQAGELNTLSDKFKELMDNVKNLTVINDTGEKKQSLLMDFSK